MVLDPLLVASVHLGSNGYVLLSSSSLYIHAKGSCAISISADAVFFDLDDESKMVPL